MITLQNDEHLILTARRHPFFLFLEMIPLLPLFALPLLLVIAAQYVDIDTLLERQTTEFMEKTGISPVPPVQMIAPDGSIIMVPGEELPDVNPRALPVFAGSVWLLLLWIALFVVWTDYYLDVLLLTNKKLIDVEQRALFSREVTSLSLERIQDITVNTEGILASLLHFGHLEIQTAGAEKKIVVRFLQNPDTIKHHILEAADKMK